MEGARVLDVSVTGTARVSAASLPHLRRSSHAAIINLCSIAALSGLPQRALYAASKGAVLDEAIFYLASPRAGSTTGTELSVDGGVTHLRVRT